MPKGDGISADAKGRTPFFSNDFGEAGDAGFGEAVVGLAAVAWSASIIMGIRDCEL